MTLRETLCLTSRPKNLDKYDLRMWLLGYAVVHGASYEPVDQLTGLLRRGDESAEIAIVAEGVDVGGEVICTLL